MKKNILYTCVEKKGIVMTYNWATNLDMLAQNGVLDYDAPSYITGQKPRYVGSPSVIPSPYAGPASNPKIPYLREPDVDEFLHEKPDKRDIVANPSWKKWVFGLVAAGALVFGGIKFKSKILPAIKKLPQTLKFDKVADFFKKGWNKFTGLFKSKKP